MGMLHDVKITTIASVAAGTSTITQGTGIDMAGYDGALFIVRLGTPATGNLLKVQQCDTVAGTYADLANSSVGGGASDNPLILDISRPKEQFLKYVVTRGTSSTIDIAMVIQYNARIKPITQPGATVGETTVSPSEGTA